MTSTFSHIAFKQTWTRWALAFFLIAALLGLLMRSFHVMEMPAVFDYKNILHTHSHLALLGWGYLMITGGIIFSLESPSELIYKYKKLFVLTLISLIAMLVTFPLQGYGVWSICFSTLHVLVSYGIAVKILRTLQMQSSGLGIRLIQIAIWFQLISTLGLWALGPVTATLGRMHELYFMSIQWFLHFQLNGWFVLGTLGLLIYRVEQVKGAIHWTVFRIWAMILSVVLTFALVITWADPNPLFFTINGFAVALQGLVYFWIFLELFIGVKSLEIPSLVKLLIYVALISLAAKAFLQLLLLLPSVAVISYTIRQFVIGFLHLVLLGVMSFGLGAVGMINGDLSQERSSTIGWLVVMTAFLSTEILLFTQGLLLWLELGFIPGYNLLLFLFSILFPLGLAILWITQLENNSQYNSQFNLTSKNPNQNTNQSMKKSLIWSLGILGILMTACGGGETQNTASSPQQEEATQEVKADPKGIGEIKNVELDESIDENLVSTGKAIVDMKCTACHQLNDKRLVGPGFQGVTNRRRPEWIMNMITNVDVMLDEDPVAQELLAECLTRMPNQNISVGDARGILEFLRKNDLEKAGEKDGAL
ncbi:c-type cytochrome [Algoriphagus hitonicola]|uniref:Cytochrome c n=1 Tax=Algoriphagus hitonicola TaxID=435880 RepID=A0A1I2VS89_9BACT|nr:cytochrome c [Algoriphagus hitonicola]SFG90061.1 Cytochrome c [Algoriphagus hitonicola]